MSLKCESVGLSSAHAFSPSQEAAGAATYIGLIRPGAVWLMGLKIISWLSQEGDPLHNPAQQQGMER